MHIHDRVVNTSNFNVLQCGKQVFVVIDAFQSLQLPVITSSVESPIVGPETRVGVVGVDTSSVLIHVRRSLIVRYGLLGGTCGTEFVVRLYIGISVSECIPIRQFGLPSRHVHLHNAPPVGGYIHVANKVGQILPPGGIRSVPVRER